jgi:hypothetical protein
LHACVEYPQDKVKGAMIAEFALRSAPGRREVRKDKCDELRLGELNGNRRRSWAFCHIAHRKWVDVKPERSTPESLTIAYNTKGYGTRKTRNHLTVNLRASRLAQLAKLRVKGLPVGADAGISEAAVSGFISDHILREA